MTEFFIVKVYIKADYHCATHRYNDLANIDRILLLIARST